MTSSLDSAPAAGTVQLLLALTESALAESASSAAALADQAVAAARVANDDATIGRALVLAAQVRAALGEEPATVLPVITEAVALLERTPEPPRDRLAAAYHLLGVVLGELFDFAGSAAAFRDGDTAAIAAGDPVLSARCRFGLAVSVAASSPRQLDRHRHHFDEALRRAEALGDAELTLLATYNLGVALREGGSPAEAIGPLTTALELATRHGEIRTEVSCHGNLARALAALGRADEAIAAARRAVDLAADPRVATILRAEAENSLGRAAFAGGLMADARRAFTTALEMATATPMPDSEAEALLGLSDVHAAIGEAGPALQYLRRYHDLWESIRDGEREQRLHAAEITNHVESLHHQLEEERRELARLMQAERDLNDQLAREIAHRALAEERTHPRGEVDEVTGLPAAGAFVHRVATALAAPVRMAVAAFQVDVDPVADRAGGADVVLVELAARLQAVTMADPDVIAGVVGPVYLAAFPAGGDDGAERVAELHHLLGHTLDAGGVRVAPRVRSGVAVQGADGDDATVLVERARLAARSLSWRTGVISTRYSADIALEADQRRHIEADLRDALAGGQLSLVYHPLVSCHDGTIIGAEALMRWNHPERGPVSPALFVPIAEESGLIEDLGAFALLHACSELAELFRTRPGFRVSVNVSVAQLRSGRVAAAIDRALSASDVPADRLVVEITESLLADSSVAMEASMRAIRERGIRVVLDDFGSGYASFASLGRLPVDGIKVDRSLVTDIDVDANAAAITDAVARMARALSLDLVAEGVERSGQLTLLAEQGYRAYQGFLSSHPIPVGELTALLLT